MQFMFFDRDDQTSQVSIRTALVYDGHLSPHITADGYFDALVPFQTLLGLKGKT